MRILLGATVTTTIRAVRLTVDFLLSKVRAVNRFVLVLIDRRSRSELLHLEQQLKQKNGEIASLNSENQTQALVIEREQQRVQTDIAMLARQQVDAENARGK